MPDVWVLSDLCTPWCVHVAATLRIAEHIDSGITRIESLAAACRGDPSALHRVLRHLVGKGMFEEPSPGEFALNEPARALLDSGVRTGLDLDNFGGRMAYTWSTLLQAVRTGRPAYDSVFGRTYWGDLDANPQIAAQFDTLMGPAGHGVADPDVLPGGDWNAVSTVVDVGGGTGSLLAAILREHPNLRGTLVDLPRTIARSDEVFRKDGVRDRVDTVGQSFFDPLPAGADLYLLKSVLSDWPDPEAAAILRRCAEAARPHGRVVIVNGVAPEQPAPDLLMLILVGGKERSLAEFTELAGTTGLRVSATALRPSGRFLVECRPD